MDPITAQLADGRQLQFPAGTDPNIVQKTVRKVMGLSNYDIPDREITPEPKDQHYYAPGHPGEMSAQESELNVSNTWAGRFHRIGKEIGGFAKDVAEAVPAGVGSLIADPIGAGTQALGGMLGGTVGIAGQVAEAGAKLTGGNPQATGELMNKVAEKVEKTPEEILSWLGVSKPGPEIKEGINKVLNLYPQAVEAGGNIVSEASPTLGAFGKGLAYAMPIEHGLSAGDLSKFAKQDREAKGYKALDPQISANIDKVQPGVETKPGESTPLDFWKQRAQNLQRKSGGAIFQGEEPIRMTPEGVGVLKEQVDRYDALDKPEVIDAIKSLTDLHEKLTDKLDKSIEKYVGYESADLFKGEEGKGFEAKYSDEVNKLHAQRDNLEEKLAAELVNHGVERRSDAQGKKIFDTVPEGVWKQLEVKVQQQQSRDFTSTLANEKGLTGLPMRSVEPGPMKVTPNELVEGRFPDQSVPIISASNPISIDTGKGTKIRQILNINGTLDHIITNTQNPVIKAVAEQLKAWNIQSKPGISMNLSLDESGNVIQGTDLKVNNAGNFILGSKVINLGPNGLTERTIVHEAVHSVTAHAFLSAIKSPSSAIKGVKDWVVDSSHPLAQHAQAIIDSWKQLNVTAQRFHAEEYAKPGHGWLYGITSPLEMMSEIGVHPDFMKWTNQQIVMLKGKPITLLGRIKEAMIGMFGKGLPSNAFDQIMFHTHEIASAYVKDPAKFDEQFHDVWKNDPVQGPKGLATPLNIPGVDKVFIYTPEPFYTAKQTILGEKDGGHEMTGQEGRIKYITKSASNYLGKVITPGSIMASTLRESTLIKNVGYIMTNAEKAAENFKNKWINPFKKALVLVKETDRAALQTVFMKELHAGARYTQDQLKQIGLNDKLINSYNRLREAFDQTIQRTNDIRASKGLEAVKPLEAYYSSRWGGMYRVSFVDGSGKPIWAVAEKTGYDRQKAINWITKNYPDLRAINMHTKTGGERFDALTAGYKEMNAFLDQDDPRTSVIKHLYEEIMGSKTENVGGHERHFDIKTGVRGFLGDRPWTNKNATDFFDSQIKYLESATKWNEYQGAFEEAHKYITDPEIRSAQPNNVGYAEDYMKHKMGYGDNKEIKYLENKLAEIFKVSPSSFMNVMTTGKSIFYIAVLAVKLPFIEISLLQHGFSMSQHAVLDEAGFKAKNPSYLIDGMWRGTQHAILDGMNFFGMPDKEVHLPFLSEMEDHWAFAREYAHANHLLEQNPLTENQEITKSQLHNTVENIGNFTTAVSEKMARGWTFYGLFGHLADSGKFDLTSHADLLKMGRLAEDATKKTMADYGSTERSMMYSKMGLMGRAASALKTYPTNMAGQLLNYTKMAAEGTQKIAKGDISGGTALMKPLAWFLGIQFAVGGLRGMFGVDDIDAVWNFIKRHIPYQAYGGLGDLKDFSIKKFMTEHLDNLMYHGPVSALTGQNISVQGSMGRVFPGFQPILDGNLTEAAREIFPSLAENWDMAAAIGKASAGFALQKAPPGIPRPSPNQMLESFYEATPAGAKGLVREQVPGFKSGDLMMNPHKLEEGEYRRNPHEHAIGNYGFTSPDEQRWVDAAHAWRENKAIMSEHRKEVIQRLEEYALRGNSEQLQYLFPLYFELGGNVQSLKKEFSEAAIEKYTDMSNRAILDIQHEENPEKIKQARDFLKAITNQ